MSLLRLFSTTKQQNKLKIPKLESIKLQTEQNKSNMERVQQSIVSGKKCLKVARAHHRGQFNRKPVLLGNFFFSNLAVYLENIPRKKEELNFVQQIHDESLYVKLYLSLSLSHSTQPFWYKIGQWCIHYHLFEARSSHAN